MWHHLIDMFRHSSSYAVSRIALREAAKDEQFFASVEEAYYNAMWSIYTPR